MTVRPNNSRDTSKCAWSARPSSAAENGSFRILHSPPDGSVETAWRKCLADCDFATHYTSPEYFLEPALRPQKPFAILSIDGNDVDGVLTGVNAGVRVQSGISVRPQIALSRRGNLNSAMTNLTAGLIAEAGKAKLVDLFVWSGMEGLIGHPFRCQRYEGVVMLDLSQGPDVLFRKFSQTTRNEIRKSLKYGVSVNIATTREDISSYYDVYVAWSRRKLLPIMDEHEFLEMFALTQNRRLFIARYQDKVIAGAVLRFLSGGMAEYAANSSLDSALQLHSNHLLQWRAIEWACSQGLRLYSLGGSHLFLRKFGGPLVPTYRYRLDRTLFRTHTVRDIASELVRFCASRAPERLVAIGRSLRNHTK